MSRELFKRGSPQVRVSWSSNRRARRRDPRRIAGWAFKAALAGALAAGAVWAGPLVASGVRGLLYHQDSLEARRLILEGNELVSRTEVLAALGVGAGDNLLELDLAEVARRLERIPAVRSATVRKQYPSALYVRIVERKPLLVVSGEEGLLIDEEGVVMGRVSQAVEGLPVVTGLEVAGGRLVDQEAVTVVASLREGARAANLGWPGFFAGLDMSDRGCPVAFLDGLVPVRLGRWPYREKLERLAKVLPAINGGGSSVAYIDLRFDFRVVVGTNPPEPKDGGKGQVNQVG